MPLYSRFLLLILGLGVVGFPAAPVAADSDADKIDQLIEQLGSGTFKDREAATKALDAIGGPALAKLRKAAESDDLEIKRRASDLVKKIEKRAESNRVLEAKRIHLVFKDTPLKDAVAEFKKKCGYDIALHDPDAKLGERKITLDTGDVTFWEAFDKFCEAAGVQQVTQQDVMQMMMEEMMKQRNPPPVPRKAPPLPAPKKEEAKPRADDKPKDKPKEEAKAAKEVELKAAKEAEAKAAKEAAVEGVAQVIEFVQVVGGGGGGPVQIQVQPAPPVRGGGGFAFGQGMGRFPTVAPDQITLMDGKRKALPTHYAGSVRIRAVETPEVPVPVGVELPLSVNLQIATEPRTQLVQIGTARITRALDDQGQSLGQAEPGENLHELPVPPGAAFPVARALVMRGAFGGMGMPPFMGGSAVTTIQLKKGEKPSKSLKELSGTLTLQVLDEPSEMLAVENVLKEGGNSSKGKSGGELKVVSSSKLENGQVKLQVELDMPPDVVPAGVRGGFGGGMMMTAPAIRLNAVVPPPPVALPQPVPAEKPKAAPAKEEKPAGKEAKSETKTAAKDEKPKAKEEAQAKPVPALPAARAIAVPAPGFGGPFVDFGTAGRYPGDIFNGLKLLDEKGQACPIAGVSTRAEAVQGGPVRITYEFTFAPKKDQAAPAKLVFSGSKKVTVEVPFTLKDVPLK